VEAEKKLQSYLNNIASYFKKSKSHSVGIDLGSNSLKIVELEKKDGKIKLKNYALVKMEEDLSEKDARLFSGQMVFEILKELSIKKTDISIAIPSYSAFITLIEVAGRTEEEIKGEIEFEAVKYIPVDLEEVVFDWQIIETPLLENKKQKIEKNLAEVQEELESETSKVLLVSTMKNVSSELQKSFNDKKLLINSIEVDCFSLQRALSHDKKDICLIFDIGGKITNIIGVKEGQLLFNRNIDLAGDRITELIAKSLNISKNRAEKLKKEQGFKSDSKIVVENILKPVFDSIIKEAEKNMEEFKELGMGEVNKIILSGGTSDMKGAKEYIQDKVEMEVVRGNPWAQIEYPKEIEEKILAKNSFFGIAVGLALVGLLEE
jgi:type IV pilus assembly protein PilM